MRPIKTVVRPVCTWGGWLAGGAESGYTPYYPLGSGRLQPALGSPTVQGELSQYWNRVQTHLSPLECSVDCPGPSPLVFAPLEREWPRPPGPLLAPQPWPQAHGLLSPSHHHHQVTLTHHHHFPPLKPGSLPPSQLTRQVAAPLRTPPPPRQDWGRPAGRESWGRLHHSHYYHPSALVDTHTKFAMHVFFS